MIRAKSGSLPCWSLVGFLLLGGCGWMSDDRGVFVDKTDDYLDAKPGPVLKVPDDLEGERVVDTTPIPDIAEQPNPRYFPKRPPLPNSIYGDDNRNEVRIQSIASRRWLVLPESPQTIWPKLKQFLAENGVGVTFEQPADGRIDTQWMQIDQPAYRDVVREVLRKSRGDANVAIGKDRVRLRVEQGLRQRTSEIHLRHENDLFATKQPTQLTNLNDIESHIPDIEQSLLNEIGAYVAAKVSEQTVSRVAENISTQVKSELGRDSNGAPVLHLYLDIERAWATVGQALRNADIDVAEENEDERSYLIAVTEQTFTGEEPGFFSRIFGRGGDDGKSLIVKLSGSSGLVRTKSFSVSVLDAESATPADHELSQRVLNLIREFSN